MQPSHEKSFTLLQATSVVQTKSSTRKGSFHLDEKPTRIASKGGENLARDLAAQHRDHQIMPEAGDDYFLFEPEMLIPEPKIVEQTHNAERVVQEKSVAGGSPAPARAEEGNGVEDDEWKQNLEFIPEALKDFIHTGSGFMEVGGRGSCGMSGVGMEEDGGWLRVVG